VDISVPSLLVAWRYMDLKRWYIVKRVELTARGFTCSWWCSGVEKDPHELSTWLVIDKAHLVDRHHFP
jgi:hypothetical protein